MWNLSTVQCDLLLLIFGNHTARTGKTCYNLEIALDK